MELKLALHLSYQNPFFLKRRIFSFPVPGPRFLEFAFMHGDDHVGPAGQIGLGGVGDAGLGRVVRVGMEHANLVQFWL